MLRGIVPEVAAEPIADALDVDQSVACVVQVDLREVAILDPVVRRLERAGGAAAGGDVAMDVEHVIADDQVVVAARQLDRCCRCILDRLLLVAVYRLQRPRLHVGLTHSLSLPKPQLRAR